MKTISMEYKEYREDLGKEYSKGFTEAIRRFKKILEIRENEPSEAVTMVCEDFEGEGSGRVLELLGLKEISYEMFNEKAES